MNLPAVRRLGLVLILIAAGLAGCGLNRRSADVFLLTRTGQGTRLTLLVNDGGTVACDGRKPRALSDHLLIGARDLADRLAADAMRNLSLPAGPGTIFTYRIMLQDGAVSFSDRGTAHHPILARAEVLAAQIAPQGCNLN